MICLHYIRLYLKFKEIQFKQDLKQSESNESMKRSVYSKLDLQNQHLFYIILKNQFLVIIHLMLDKKVINGL